MSWDGFDIPDEAMLVLDPDRVLSDFGSRSGLTGRNQEISKAAGYFPGQGDNSSYDINKKKVTGVGSLAPTMIPSTGKGRQAGSGRKSPAAVMPTAKGYRAGTGRLTPAEIQTTAKVRKSFWDVDHGVVNKAWKDDDKDTPAGKEQERKAAKKKNLSYEKYEKKFKGEGKDVEKKWSENKRAATATAFPGYHGAAAGKPGKKVRAAGSEIAGAVGGSLAGQAVGGALTRGKVGGQLAGAFAGQAAGGYAGYRHNKKVGNYRKIRGQ